MTDSQSVDRRTVLQTVAGFAAATLGVSAAGVATADSEARSPQPAAPSRSFGSGPTRRSRLTGFYTGTVDRIVDGEHVVLLLSEGGRVREQYVVSRRRCPGLAAGDSVTLVVFRGHLFAVW
ncbi:MAG: hypothetical protein V5A55_05890 [Halovenus sp.]